MSLASHILYLHPKYHKKVQASECTCDFCDATFNSRDGLRDHLKCRHGNDGVAKIVPTQCPFCQTMHDTVDHYFDHANDTHPEKLLKEGWIVCNSCKIFLPTETTYILHRKNCKPSSIGRTEEASSISCEFCPETFESLFNYYGHANQSHSELILAARWLRCQYCDKLIAPDRFEVHKPKCAGANRDDEAETKQTKRKRQKEIVCPYCPMTFLHNHNFQFHVNQRHREQLIEANWVPCDNCPKLFVNKTRLQTHQKACLQNKPLTKKKSKVYPQKTNIKCSFCPQVFINGGKYYAHANKSHMATIASFWLSCPECQVRFPTMRAMRMHLVRCNVSKKQQDNPQVPCQFCDLAFPLTEEMVDHGNSEHLDDIKDTWSLCPGCNNYFPDSAFLERHVNVCGGRSNPDMNLCQFCFKSFSNRKSVYRHVNRDHETELARTKSWTFCQKCETYFPNNDAHFDSCLSTF